MLSRQTTGAALSALPALTFAALCGFEPFSVRYTVVSALLGAAVPLVLCIFDGVENRLRRSTRQPTPSAC